MNPPRSFIATFQRKYLGFILCLVCEVSSIAIAQSGVDGHYTAPAGVSQVNRYGTLSAGITAGATSFSVTSIDSLDRDAALPLSYFRQDLAGGDLVLLYQARGATISGLNSSGFGNVTSYGNAGRLTFCQVTNVVGNTITCSSAVPYDFSAQAMVVRVPQYLSLTVGNGNTLEAATWNGTTGGIFTASVVGTTTVNGLIDASSRGFRGGVATVPGAGDANINTTSYRSTTTDDGADKGEGIAGYQTDYTAIGGRYGRGAPANGGGGGNNHNAGGGGGANGGVVTDWIDGQGVMDMAALVYWQLDPTYAIAPMGLKSRSGGGRGGYSYSSPDPADFDAAVLAPGSIQWLGNRRRERGGLGGRPLDAALVPDNSRRLFMGGGGGAGHANNGDAGSGGRGGGVVLVVTTNITGTGELRANGGSGGNTTARGWDAAGGAGGGGTVLLIAQAHSGVTVSANGGVGGNQTIPAQPSPDFFEADGPGGGGGGGVVLMPSGFVVSASVSGGLAGITDSGSMTEWPNNGAMRGGLGTFSTTVPECNSIFDCPLLDTDGDDLPDSLETIILGTNPNNADSDGDTLNDLIETTPTGGGLISAIDTDGDGTIDAQDLDSDADCIRDHVEVSPNYRIATGSQAAADAGCVAVNPVLPYCQLATGVCSATCQFNNQCSDVTPLTYCNAGTCAFVDTDGDGVTDVVENGLGTLSNNPDSDGDGITDNIELSMMGVAGPFSAIDTDGDGTIDALDTDSDNDCILDSRPIETVANYRMPAGQVMADAECVLINALLPICNLTVGSCTTACTLDSDCGGVTSGRVCTGAPLVCDDGCRGMGGNGCAVNFTCSSMTGAVGVCNPTDSDGDGISDVIETMIGTQGNNVDSDGDGISDNVETSASGSNGPFLAIDTDGDGVIDGLDLDSDNDCTSDAIELAPGYRVATSQASADAYCDTVMPVGSTPFCNLTMGVCSGACAFDMQCGGMTSGVICNAATCEPGCRGTGGNQCMSGQVCSSDDATAGICSTPVVPDDPPVTTTPTPETPSPLTPVPITVSPGLEEQPIGIVPSSDNGILGGGGLSCGISKGSDTPSWFTWSWLLCVGFLHRRRKYRM